MATVRVRTALPTTRKDGTTAPASQVKGWLLLTRVDAVPEWTQLGPLTAANSLEQTVQGVGNGKQHFRVVFVDIFDQLGDPRDGTIDVKPSALSAPPPIDLAIV